MDNRTVYERLYSLEENVSGHERQLGGLEIAKALCDLELEVQCLREELGNYGGAPKGE